MSRHTFSTLKTPVISPKVEVLRLNKLDYDVSVPIKACGGKKHGRGSGQPFFNYIVIT
jgi:hypothetical protein